MNSEKTPVLLGLIILLALFLTGIAIEVVKFLAYWQVAFA